MRVEVLEVLRRVGLRPEEGRVRHGQHAGLVDLPRARDRSAYARRMNAPM